MLSTFYQHKILLQTLTSCFGFLKHKHEIESCLSCQDTLLWGKQMILMICAARCLLNTQLIFLLTGVLIDPLLHGVLLLVNPLAVAFEVDLGGRRGLAVQVNRLVLHYVGLLWLHQEHREWLWGVWREGFWQLTETNEVILNCEERNRGGIVTRKDEERKEGRTEAGIPRRRAGGWVGRGESRQETVGQYYNHSLCMGLSICRAHSEIPIIWYFRMFTQVHFGAQEILRFLSGNEAARSLWPQLPGNEHGGAITRGRVQRSALRNRSYKLIEPCLPFCLACARSFAFVTFPRAYVHARTHAADLTTSGFWPISCHSSDTSAVDRYASL